MILTKKVCNRNKKYKNSIKIRKHFVLKLGVNIFSKNVLIWVSKKSFYFKIKD